MAARETIRDVARWRIETPPLPICRSMQTLSEADGSAVEEIEATGAKIAAARDAIGEVIFGQEAVIDQTLVTVLAGGHALLVGVPGLAKTLLVHTMGQVLGLDDKRVQFTPDLMPADILGSEVLEESDQGHRSFRFIKGPVFCQLLMADEINRASPAPSPRCCRRCRKSR